MCHDAIVVSYVSWRHCGIVIINFDVLKDLIYHEEYLRNGKINIRMIRGIKGIRATCHCYWICTGFFAHFIGWNFLVRTTVFQARKFQYEHKLKQRRMGEEVGVNATLGVGSV